MALGHSRVTVDSVELLDRGINPMSRVDAAKHRIFPISLANARLGARARCTEDVSDAKKTPINVAKPRVRVVEQTDRQTQNITIGDRPSFKAPYI